ncbi:hypothetical protein ACWEO2_27840 [Nocardia sp. NPDC004278]
MRTTLDAKVLAAQQALDAAADRVRREEHIHLELPDPNVPRSRCFAELRDGDRSIVIQGPERVALVGRNGMGKSTLIEAGPGGVSADSVETGRSTLLPRSRSRPADCGSCPANSVASSSPGRGLPLPQRDGHRSELPGGGAYRSNRNGQRAESVGRPRWC